MTNITEVLFPSVDDIDDVIRQAEAILVQAVFEDMIRILTPVELTVGFASLFTPTRKNQTARGASRLVTGWQGTVFPWERSPPRT